MAATATWGDGDAADQPEGDVGMPIRGLGAWALALAVLAALLIQPVPGVAQAIDWTSVIRELSGDGPQAPQGPQSRVDPEALRALEARSLGGRGGGNRVAEGQTAPAAGASTAGSVLDRGGRGVLATPALLAPSGDTAQPRPPTAADYGELGTTGQRQRPPDLAAYGRLSGGYADTMIGRTSAGVDTFRARMQMLVQAAPTLRLSLAETLRAATPTGSLSYFLPILGAIAIMLAAARGTGALLGRFVGLRIMEAMQRASPPIGMAGKLPVLATRVVSTAVIMLLSVLVAAGIGLVILDKSRIAEVTAGMAVGFYAVYFVIDAMWRMVISPYLPAYRIPKIDDQGAKRLYLWISAAAFVSLLGETVLLWLVEIGAEDFVVVLASIVLRLVAVALIIAMIWVNRAAINSCILGGRSSLDANWLAAAAALVTAPLVTIYFVAAWFEGSVRLVLGLRQGLPLFLGPFVTLMVSLLVYAIGTYLVEVAFARARARAQLNREAEARARANEDAGTTMPPLGATVVALPRQPEDGGDDDEDGAATPHAQPGAVPAAPRAPHQMRTFEDLGYRVASLLAVCVGAYMMARIWLGPTVFADGSPLGWLDNIIDKLFIGYIAYHGVRIWLDQRIEEEGGDVVMGEPGDEGGGASATSRLGTLLPLFRSFILAVIGLSVLLLVAVDFGVNVAPLFAGAGIVGLALGFGAQTLVRDILSGVFFLIDDAFRKGEYIDVGEVKGTVEKISLRSFQLRHHLGALNTIPFGEIKHLTNFSRDWVMTKLPLRLTYDTDVEKVRKLIKKLGEELLHHPTEGHKFVQPLKSQGVYQMEDSAMIIRVKFMTRPGDQWTTRKIVYQEIRSLFEREGIKFAHKEVLVRVPGLDPKDPRSTEIAGAAARRVIEEERPISIGALAEGR